MRSVGRDILEYSNDKLVERNPLQRHLYLTGFRGTGKTSVGTILAEKLSRPLVDLDSEIESTAKQTIREIFANGGESLFRDLESQSLAFLADKPASIISLGGGAVLRPSNREIIAETGLAVWLDADAETIAARIDADTTTAERRPALTQLSNIEEIRTLLDQRRPIYEQVAVLRLDTTNKSVTEIAEEVADWFKDISRAFSNNRTPR